MTAKENSGFTITELMVSVVVLGLISLAATSTLSFGNRIWSKARTVPAVSLVEAEINTLRAAISRKISVNSEEGGGFAGSTTHFTFRGLVESTDNMFEIGSVTVEIQDDEMRIRSSNANVDRTKELRQIKPEKLAYYGKSGKNDASQWHDEWDAADPIPILVRLSLTDQQNDGLNELIFKISD
ncbi:MAG: prepilin-type N-terminal cleavage/methylation domain-containing protein [Pseudomonadota bacterium]